MSSVNCSRDTLPSFSKIIESLGDTVDKMGPKTMLTASSQVPVPVEPQAVKTSLGSSQGSLPPFSRHPTSQQSHQPQMQHMSHQMPQSSAIATPTSHQRVLSYSSNPPFGTFSQAPFFTFGPQHSSHQSNESYPANYQFPVSARTPVTPPVDVNNIQTAWNDYQRTVAYLGEVSNGLEALKRAQDMVNPQGVTSEALHGMFMSIPVALLSNMEFYCKESHKLLEQMRAVQGVYMRNKETSQAFVAHEARVPQQPGHSRNRFSMGDISLQSNKNTKPEHARFRSDSAITTMEPGEKEKSENVRPFQGRKSSSPKAKKQPPVSKRGSIIKFDSLREKVPSPTNCVHCGSGKTPEWRRGPEGEKTLCNACGIFYSKLIKKYHSPAEAARIMQQRKSKGLEMDRHV